MSLSHGKSPVLLKVFKTDARRVLRHGVASSKSYVESLLGGLNLPMRLQRCGDRGTASAIQEAGLRTGFLCLLFRPSVCPHLNISSGSVVYVSPANPWPVMVKQTLPSYIRVVHVCVQEERGFCFQLFVLREWFTQLWGLVCLKSTGPEDRGRG